MSSDTLTSLREELDAQRADLERTMAAIETVTAFLDDAAGRGFAARVDHADRAAISIRVDLAPGIDASAVSRAVPPGNVDPNFGVPSGPPGMLPEEEGEQLDPSIPDFLKRTPPRKTQVAEAAPAPKSAATPTPQRPAKWTAEDDEKAVGMYLAGKPIAEIASAVGRPKEGTRFRLQKLRAWRGIPTRTEGRPAKPKKTSDIKVSPSPKDAKRPSTDQATAAPRADGGREAQVDGARPAKAAPAQTGTAPRAEQRPQAKQVSTGTAAPHSDLTISQRTLASRLSALPFSDWTLDDDLDLVEAIVRGARVDVVAADLERKRSDCLARWKLLCPTPGPGAQADLLAVLRRRVAEARGAA